MPDTARHPSRDSTDAAVTWRTATGAIAIATALTAAAVGGFLLAGRGGGLARADRVLTMVPEGVSLVAVADVAALRLALGTSGENLVLPGIGWTLPGHGVERLYLFGSSPRTLGAILEGQLRGAELPGTRIGEYQGIEVRQLGAGLELASLGEGRAVVGARPLVRQVLDTARGRGRSLPSAPEFLSLRELAMHARDFAPLQLVVFPGRATLPPEARAAWPAAAAAKSVGFFARFKDEAIEVRILVDAPAEVLAKAESELAENRGAVPLTVTREGALLAASARLPRGTPLAAWPPAPRFFAAFLLPSS